jgi:hypothetical protein
MTHEGNELLRRLLAANGCERLPVVKVDAVLATSLPMAPLRRCRSRRPAIRLRGRSRG